MIVRAPRIPVKKRNALIKCFGLDLDATNAGKVSKVSRTCANRWYRHFREIIYMATRRAPRFFGEVEMDQSEFGGRGRKRMQALLKRYAKVMPHAEYMAKAREIRREHKVLVFGILHRGGEVYTHVIKHADRTTLQPIVRLVVEQGSTVYTDKWRGFTELGLDGYTHRSVNHSEEYVAKDGTHINGIEAFWSFAHRRTRKFNGIARTTLPLHIKECEWRYNHRDVEAALKSLVAHHQNPSPPHRDDKSISRSRPLPRPKAQRLRTRRTSRTGSGPKASVRRRARPRKR